jgi:ABC-type uncharacterized transport system involved in gliding motility auxiliary subunit
MKRNDITGLLGRRVPVGSKEIGEQAQYSIDDIIMARDRSQKA